MEQQPTQPTETTKPQAAPTVRTGSSWKNILPGLFIGILVGIAGILFYQKHQPDITTALYTATWVLFGLVIITFLLFWGLRTYLTRFVFGSKTANAGDVLEDAQRVSDVITERFADKILADLPSPERDRIKHILPRLANWFFWGRLRNWWWQWILGIFVSLGGITGTMLLMNQNKLLENQNNLIKRQLSLEEASRRSALVVLMSNILDKVDREIENQLRDTLRHQWDKFTISPSLIGQIAALSHSFKPYYFMDGDTLIPRALSPERGQLLITLTSIPLNDLTLLEIYSSSNFKEADLQGAILEGANLVGANLEGANFEGANLKNVVFCSKRFNFGGLKLQEEMESNGGNVRVAQMKLRKLIIENIKMAKLKDANLKGADLKGSNLEVVNDLTPSQLEQVKSLWDTKLPKTIDSLLHITHPHLFIKPEG